VDESFFGSLFASPAGREETRSFRQLGPPRLHWRKDRVSSLPAGEAESEPKNDSSTHEMSSEDERKTKKRLLEELNWRKENKKKEKDKGPGPLSSRPCLVLERQRTHKNHTKSRVKGKECTQGQSTGACAIQAVPSLGGL